MIWRNYNCFFVVVRLLVVVVVLITCGTLSACYSCKYPKHTPKAWDSIQSVCLHAVYVQQVSAQPWSDGSRQLASLQIQRVPALQLLGTIFIHVILTWTALMGLHWPQKRAQVWLLPPHCLCLPSPSTMGSSGNTPGWSDVGKLIWARCLGDGWEWRRCMCLMCGYWSASSIFAPQEKGPSFARSSAFL